VTALRMADPLYEDDSDGEVAKKAATPSSRQGGVSDAMRAKLLKENSALGGDPDAPSINFGTTTFAPSQQALHVPASCRACAVYRESRTKVCLCLVPWNSAGHRRHYRHPPHLGKRYRRHLSTREGLWHQRLWRKESEGD
jgi:hypothetical protein